MSFVKRKMNRGWQFLFYFMMVVHIISCELWPLYIILMRLYFLKCTSQMDHKKMETEDGE